MSIPKPKFGPERYAAGTVIVRQGDIPDKFYIIASGYVNVEHTSSQGKAIIDYLGPGDFFGEVGLVKKRRRNATVRAETDVEVMAMDQQTFADWFQSSLMVREEINELIDVRVQRVERHGGDSEGDGRLESNVFRALHEEIEEETADPPSTPASLPETGPLHFDPGNIIVQQGRTANRFYIIIEGEVEIVRRDETGEEAVIGNLADGDYFGEIGLLEGQERTATVRALSHVKALPFTRDQFQTWLQKSPDSEDAIKKTAHARLTRDTGELHLPE
jgi:CRP-like cAMP-binding protein